MLTVLIYLSDVEEGGETVFPNVPAPLHQSPGEFSECGMQGLAVKPRRGDAAVFWSLKTTGQVNRGALHGGCPVIRGEKCDLFPMHCNAPYVHYNCEQNSSFPEDSTSVPYRMTLVKRCQWSGAEGCGRTQRLLRFLHCEWSRTQAPIDGRYITSLPAPCVRQDKVTSSSCPDDLMWELPFVLHLMRSGSILLLHAGIFHLNQQLNTSVCADSQPRSGSTWHLTPSAGSCLLYTSDAADE